MENENKKTFFKTLPGILTGIAALITALTGLYIAYQSTRQPKDLVQQMPRQQPIQEQRQPEKTPMKEELIKHMQRARRLAEDYLNAYQNNNIDKIMQISATPFYFLHEILFRPEDISRRFEEVFSQKAANFYVEAIEAKTIGELIRGDINRELRRIIESLNLSHEEIIIEITWSLPNYQGKLFLFTRWIDDDLRLIGWYNRE